MKTLICRKVVVMIDHPVLQTTVMAILNGVKDRMLLHPILKPTESDNLTYLKAADVLIILGEPDTANQAYRENIPIIFIHPDSVMTEGRTEAETKARMVLMVGIRILHPNLRVLMADSPTFREELLSDLYEFVDPQPLSNRECISKNS